ncbi:MAG: hypothetical protein KDA44_01970 [Planctomycetales bacterium]|nr:hypothetical protein [Planctomycetales bacterium]
MASEPAPAPRRRGQAEYLVRMLQLHPAAASDEIIAIRSRALGLTPKSQPATRAGDDPATRRAAALEKLQQIRQKCWSAPPEQLVAQLDALRADDLPDVRAASHRLRVLARNRRHLPRLVEQKGFDGEFFVALKQVLAGSPRETNVTREQMVARFRSGDLRKRGRRMIALLKRETPELYELESAWFESLLRQKKSNASRAERKSDVVVADTSSGDIPWWVWWVGISVILRIISHM